MIRFHTSKLLRIFSSIPPYKSHKPLFCELEDNILKIDYKDINSVEKMHNLILVRREYNRYESIYGPNIISDIRYLPTKEGRDHADYKFSMRVKSNELLRECKYKNFMLYMKYQFTLFYKFPDYSSWKFSWLDKWDVQI
tara:strand:+ start:5744 stop:6160 length:417 start_codon:yes stop_codon:yes gene_type:complete